MKTNVYLNTTQFISGITMKDGSENENNNMALHVCENLEQIVENRKRLASSLNCRLNDFVCANQTHSANFHRVTIEDKGRGATQMETAIKDTDALYTYEPNLLICGFVADCVPIIFHNKENGLIGVIHSGWQGTVKEISLRVFNHLIEVEQCHPSDLHVQIGPALSQEKFEVDEDVYLKFKALGYTDDFVYYNDQSHKYHIDNQQVVKKQIELVGIPTGQILIEPTCTYMSPNGFSYREDKKTGRHLAFIMRKEEDK